MKRTSFGEYIRLLRTQNHMTQASLANSLHVTDKAVSKWERDLSYPDVSLFPKLADLLGVTVNDLFEACSADARPSRLMQIFEMSHDLRTPLHIILGCADMAQMNKDDPELLTRYLASIRISGEYLLDMINRVMLATDQDKDRLSAKQFPASINELGEFLRTHEHTPDTITGRYDLSGKRILIAEDIELNREIVREILKRAGAETESAENGQVCLDMVRTAPSGHFDLILMDIMMPVMDGLEATRRIRGLRDPEKSSIPVIALSANVYEKDRAAALEAGMSDFADKPVFSDRLLAVIQNNLK